MVTSVKKGARTLDGAINDDNDGSEEEVQIPSETLIVTKPGSETVDEKQGERKLWVDVLSDNRNPAKGMTMEYVAPKLVNGEVEIEIDKEDVATGI